MMEENASHPAFESQIRLVDDDGDDESQPRELPTVDPTEAPNDHLKELSDLLDATASVCNLEDFVPHTENQHKLILLRWTHDHNLPRWGYWG